MKRSLSLVSYFVNLGTFLALNNVFRYFALPVLICLFFNVINFKTCVETGFSLKNIHLNLCVCVQEIRQFYSRKTGVKCAYIRFLIYNIFLTKIFLFSPKSPFEFVFQRYEFTKVILQLKSRCEMFVLKLSGYTNIIILKQAYFFQMLQPYLMIQSKRGINLNLSNYKFPISIQQQRQKYRGKVSPDNLFYFV